MRKKRYVVLAYFTLFYLLLYFIFVLCSKFLEWEYYNPSLFAFIFAVVFTYFVFLVLHGLKISDSFRVTKHEWMSGEIKAIKNEISNVDRRVDRIEGCILTDKKKKRNNRK